MEPAGLISQVQFSQDAVRILTSKDFALDSKEKIALKFSNCILVLFYTANDESSKLVKIWAIVAQQTPGPIFAAVNLINEREIAAAFTTLGTEETNPLHRYSLLGYPTILVYRDGWPAAFYNGERSVSAITDWSLTKACRANYLEPIQVPASMAVDNNYEMGGWKEYKPIRKDSLEYKTNNPVRGYNASKPLEKVSADVGVARGAAGGAGSTIVGPTTVVAPTTTKAPAVVAPTNAGTKVTTATTSPTVAGGQGGLTRRATAARVGAQEKVKNA